MIEIYFTNDKKEVINNGKTKKYDISASFDNILKFISPDDEVIVFSDVKNLVEIRKKTHNKYRFSYEIYKNNINNLDEATIYSDLEKLWKNEIKYVVYKPKNKILGERVYITANNVQLNVRDLVVPVKDIRKLWENPKKYMIKSVFNGMELAE